ncbi:MAG: hypothetical protein V4591_02155 [Bdellovibrionota bacterium]
MSIFSLSKIESILIFSIFIVFCLVIFSIVPNSFSISLIGFGLSVIWLTFILKNKNSCMPEFLFEKKIFFIGLYFWLFLVLIAVGIGAYARFISPGYDLYWFSQAVTNAKIGNGLHISSERIFPTLLVQHWEPILYTIIPFTFFFSGAVSAVLWQTLGLWGGTIGAWKLSSLVFEKSELKNLKYYLTIFYVVSWANINPLSFDIHPPVFGALLFIPWIIFFILKQKKIIAILLLLLLMQCGEIFFAVAPAYFVYLILEKKITPSRAVISIIFYFSGFLLIGVYQKYIGPKWSGLSFAFAGRYGSIGGDGMGILQTFVHHPFDVISQFIAAKKIKTFLKIFIYYGLLPIFSLLCKKYRLLAVCIWLGCLPYFIQVGVANDVGMSNTNMHYIAALGSQWWCLSLFGLYAINEKFVYFSLKEKLILPLFLILFFLNSSEWRKSPLYPFRGFIEREHADSGTRQYLASLPKSEGVLLAGVEWLCPLAADERYYTLCYVGHEDYLPIMPLDTIIASQEGLKYVYNSLSRDIKKTKNAEIILSILSEDLQKIHWIKIADKEQKNSDGVSTHYSIWHKQ